MPAHRAPGDKAIGCRVQYTTTVDRPDLRDPSYPKVKPGYKIPEEQFFAHCKHAEARFKGLIRGEDDFASEYVSSAQVDVVWLRGGPTTYRRRVERTRGQHLAGAGRRR